MIRHVSASASGILDANSKYYICIYNVNCFELITQQNKKANIHNLEDLSPIFDDKSGVLEQLRSTS